MSNKQSPFTQEAKKVIGFMGIFLFVAFVFSFFFMSPSNAQEASAATKAPTAEKIREAHRDARAKLGQINPSYCGAYIPPGVELSQEEVRKLGAVHGCSEVTVFFYGH